MKNSPFVRSTLGRLSVWAQVNHPVGTGKVMRKLTSSSSSKKKHHTSTQAETVRIAGLSAADAAAGVPRGTNPDGRKNGIALANQAARIPGCY